MNFTAAEISRTAEGIIISFENFYLSAGRKKLNHFIPGNKALGIKGNKNIAGPDIANQLHKNLCNLTFFIIVGAVPVSRDSRNPADIVGIRALVICNQVKHKII